MLHSLLLVLKCCCSASEVQLRVAWIGRDFKDHLFPFPCCRPSGSVQINMESLMSGRSSKITKCNSNPSPLCHWTTSLSGAWVPTWRWWLHTRISPSSTPESSLIGICSNTGAGQAWTKAPPASLFLPFWAWCVPHCYKGGSEEFSLIGFWTLTFGTHI